MRGPPTIPEPERMMRAVHARAAPAERFGQGLSGRLAGRAWAMEGPRLVALMRGEAGTTGRGQDCAFRSALSCPPSFASPACHLGPCLPRLSPFIHSFILRTASPSPFHYSARCPFFRSGTSEMKPGFVCTQPTCFAGRGGVGWPFSKTWGRLRSSARFVCWANVRRTLSFGLGLDCDCESIAIVSRNNRSARSVTLA